LNVVYGDVITPAGMVQSATIEINAIGCIASVTNAAQPCSGAAPPAALVVPGFVDIHVHGGGGADFMDGSVDAVRTVARTHAQFGTTSLLATTLTASQAEVDSAIRAILEVMRAPGPDEARICGIHLEGPYICKARKGAQPEKFIRLPDIEELRHWQELSDGNLKKITLAPELPGAIELITAVVSMGIKASIGHTNADFDTVEKAISAGANQGTHLFNAMSAMTHRAPGAVGALLENDGVLCELICDGVHVAPEVVKVAVRAKGVDGVVLITDAMSGTSMPDGEYVLGGQKVIVQTGAAKFIDGTLAGSVLTMDRAFFNVSRYASVLVEMASKMASLNAARAIGLERRKGTIEKGKDADFVIIDPISREVIRTIVMGQTVYFR
jgi:N-acetylglucosamine-6-phosphate deacetylase